MEIQELNQLPYEKRKKIVKRLYEKKYMTRQEMYKTTNRGRKLRKEEAIALDQLYNEVNNEIPEVIPEKVVKEKVTPERKPEPEVKKKISIEPRYDVIVDKGAKKNVEEIPRAEIEEVVNNAKWKKDDYAYAVTMMDNNYTRVMADSSKLPELKKTFFEYATEKKYFKRLSDKIFDDLKVKYGLIEKPKEEKPKETPEEKVITKAMLQEAIKNAKWNTAAYVNAIAKMDRKNPYGDPSNEDFEKKEIIEEFYNLALYPENFKKIKNLPAFKNI